MFQIPEKDNSFRSYLSEMFNNNYPQEIYEVLDDIFRIPVSIIITDAEAHIVYINNDYAKFLNVEQSSVIGLNIREVIPNSRAPIVLETGIPEISQPHTYKNGEKSIVHRIPIFDNDGKIKGLFGIIVFKTLDELQELARINQCLKTQINAYRNVIKGIYKAKYTFADIIGKSQSIQQKISLAKRFAKSDATVLITGETGTGKELWAHAIHNASSRKENAFVSVNCGAIPENLLESELFGYEEGAFTGAKKGGKLGKFQLAKKGTLFLDEIGDMPLSMQVKILRALQEKEIERVGGSTEKIDFRVITATNRNLTEMVREGRFREDLFYRLNICTLNLLPLREHREDIHLLVKHFINQYSNNSGIIRTMDTECLESLQKYSWPGNVRQLAAVIERVLLTVDAPMINVTDLPDSILLESGLKRRNEKNKLDCLLAEVEKECIINALSICNNCKTETARYLGIARSRLYRKLEEYKIDTHIA